MSAQLTFHPIESPSRSERVWWLLEELGVEYDVEYHLRTPTLMRGAPEELMKYSLFGKGPAVTLDGESFGESAYVIHRLLADSRLTVNNAELETSPSNDSTFWTTAAESAGMLWFQMYAMVNAGAKAWIDGREGDAKREEEREVLERFREWYCQEICWPQGQNFISKVEQYLAAHPGNNFSGNDKFGEGDFMMFSLLRSLMVGGRRNLGYAVGPHTKAWWERVSSRPAAKRAMDKMNKLEAEALAKASK